MKLATFTDKKGTRIGIVKEQKIIDLSLAAPELPTEMIEFLSLGEPGLNAAALADTTAPHLTLDEVTLESPVLRPGKILAIGLNYKEHVVESRQETPKYPVVFTKHATSTNGPYADVYWSEDSKLLDYECELAFIIGKKCRRVPTEKAYQVIAGYTVCNDISVRDWQTRGELPQFMMGKSWDTHCPLGPYLTTADEVDPHNLSISTHVNGEIRQDSNTNDLLFNCYDLVNYISTALTLEPGDVIVTGTPSGIGAVMKPPRWLKVGDSVKVEIENLGYIENKIVKEPDSVTTY